jgi:hypothetical protein
VSDAQAALGGLRDIRGVEGSFLLRRADGACVTRDGLAVISEPGLAETARRLANAFLAVGQVCPKADEIVQRFEGMTLFTRQGEHVILGVLASDKVSMPALRMGGNLVLRPVDFPGVVPSPVSSPPEAAPATSAPRRMWRGTPI